MRRKYIHTFWSLFAFGAITMSLTACKGNPFDVDISSVPPQRVEIDRFEQSFYRISDVRDLAALRQKYRFFFNRSMSDASLLEKSKDEREQRLFLSVSKHFPDMKTYEKQVAELFRYIKYYYPRFVAPRVFSYVSKLDYPYDVVYADSLMFISLDFFLGQKEGFYREFPSYISATFEPKYLTRAVAYSIVQRMIPQIKLNTLLDGMIYEGKKILLMRALMPKAPLSTLLKYNEKQLDWCRRNQKQVWAYLVSKELFYQPYKREAHRFLTEAPFSKFYLDIDRSSPGRIGVWLGYEILRSYIDEHPEESLISIIEQIDSGWIFRNSGYRPADQ